MVRLTSPPCLTRIVTIYLGVDIEPVSPTVQIQAELTSIISELLKVPVIGIDDNFFRVGANSLLVAQIIVRARRAFGIELSPSAVFNRPTVAALTIEIENRILEVWAPLPSPRSFNSCNASMYVQEL